MRYKRYRFISAFSMTAGLALGLTAMLLHSFSGPYASPTLALGIGAAVLAGAAAFMAIITSNRLAEERKQHRIFIIYAREDLDVARRLAVELKERGLSVWLDIDEVQPGEIWERAVMRALESSTVAIALVSKHLSKRGFVQEELKVALGTLQGPGKDMSPVIPVRLDDSELPASLSHVLAVDFYDEAGRERLISGLAKMTSGGHEGRSDR